MEGLTTADPVHAHACWFSTEDGWHCSEGCSVTAMKDLTRLLAIVLTDGDFDSRVERLNEIREIVHGLSPFQAEPVDLVQWVRADSVGANDYNPNVVAPPEMKLLELSIMADGYTQPIVAMGDGSGYVVVDGFHRTRVGKESPLVSERVHSYLPVVQIRGDRTEVPDRMASTIRHNRARGKHQVQAMADIVIELKRRNWSDEKVGRELGMDADEVLRLTQITGLAEAFKDRDFSEAWEAVLDIDDEDTLDVVDDA